MWLIAFMVIFVGTVFVIGAIGAWQERQYDKFKKEKENPS